ncbi:MAG: ABC transporter permease subunit [Akkermansia sp.]
MNESTPRPAKRVPQPIPQRFQVAKTTLWFDRFMTGVIMSGGFVIIAAVLGIFFFILNETLPLFGRASVTQEQSISTVIPDKAALALDETGQKVIYYAGRDSVEFVHRNSKKTSTHPLHLPDKSQASAWKYLGNDHLLLLGTSDGKVGSNRLHFEGNDVVSATDDFYCMEEDAQRSDQIIALDYGGAGDAKLYAAIQEKADHSRKVRLLLLSQQTSLMDTSGTLEPSAWFDITPSIEGTPEKILVNSSANGVLVYTNCGKILYFEVHEDGATLQQTITNPLDHGEQVTTLGWIYGDVSFVVGGERGSIKTYALYRQKDEKTGMLNRRFGATKHYEPLNGAVQLFNASTRNKSFLIAGDQELRLIFNTAEEIRWEGTLDYTPTSMTTDKDFKTLLVQDKKGGLHFYGINDAYPEAGMKALFSKIWYEGYDQPSWDWQSSAANDDAEPKMSLMNLVFGTLKGTFYALIFAVPIALMAAIYTSQFMPASVKRIVKPLMEIMASLPSVVLGFFGALYLAPKMEDKVPAIIAMCIVIPLSAMLIGYYWARLPIRIRNKFGNGLEYLVMIPLMSFLGWLCWSSLGSGLESGIIEGTRYLFSALNGISSWSSCFSWLNLGWDFNPNFQAASFAELWQNGFNLPFEQRNSLVVGFIMGFAVIPVIFTIAEDSLSNVPVSLLAGAEALGASRWQIVRTVVLPIAAAGIFSALMIGLGRAVGETMIVLMATGNTPITEWNVFNGMRTLSANIATELPEAVEHSGHYRVLFLSALILFAMTFVLNTLSETLRHRLRERFKVI